MNDNEFEIDIYENQEKLKNGLYKTTLLFAHNDQFGREKTMDELEEIIAEQTGCSIENFPSEEEIVKTWKLKIIPLSVKPDLKINCFLLEIESAKPINSGDYEQHDYPWPLQVLDDIYYYHIVPVFWNPVITQKEKTQ